MMLFCYVKQIQTDLSLHLFAQHLQRVLYCDNKYTFWPNLQCVKTRFRSMKMRFIFSLTTLFPMPPVSPHDFSIRRYLFLRHKASYDGSLINQWLSEQKAFVNIISFQLGTFIPPFFQFFYSFSNLLPSGDFSVFENRK